MFDEDIEISARTLLKMCKRNEDYEEILSAVLNDACDKDIMKEVDKRGLIPKEGYKLHRILCDIVEVPYPTKKEEILKKLSSMF